MSDTLSELCWRAYSAIAADTLPERVKLMSVDVARLLFERRCLVLLA